MKGWEIVNRIKVLLADGKSVSAVARELGVDRKTVRKYRDREMGQIAEERRKSRRRSRNLDEYAEFIKALVKAMAADGVINARSIYNELKELGYQGSARSVRRYVAELRPHHAKRRIYRPFETPPGRQAMVDLGEKRQVPLGGRRQTVHFIGMLLCRSRKKYLEWFDRPVDTETFIAFHQRAFEFFGGQVEEVVYDQTKLAVLSEHYGEVDFNEAFYGFAQYCGFRPWVCNKRDPETKGKVESVVRYVKRGFLPGRRFDDLADLRRQSGRWLQEVADEKVHETTGRRPHEAWQEEKRHLLPFKEGFRPRPSFRHRQVRQDGLVKVLGNRYSVPSEHHGLGVKVRITETQVEIHTLEGGFLWRHRRAQGRGKRIIEPSHYRKNYSVPTGELTRRLMEIYASEELAAELRKNFPRHYREQCKRLIALQQHFQKTLLRQACRRVLAYGCASYKNLKAAAEHLASQSEPSSEIPAPDDCRLPEDVGVQPRESVYYDSLPANGEAAS